MAVESRTVARPYAEAAFQVARENSQMEPWAEMLAFLGALGQDELFQSFVENPKIDQAQLTAFVLDLAGDRVHEQGKNLLRLLVENKRLGLLPEINEIFLELKNRQDNVLDVVVTSAYAMNAAQSKLLAEHLERKLGHGVTISAIKDPDLIGGIHIRAGDTVIDASIKGQLIKLANQLGI